MSAPPGPGMPPDPLAGVDDLRARLGQGEGEDAELMARLYRGWAALLEHRSGVAEAARKPERFGRSAPADAEALEVLAGQLAASSVPVEAEAWEARDRLGPAEGRAAARR